MAAPLRAVATERLRRVGPVVWELPRDEIPRAYRKVGQPVFIPGAMGTSSYVLVGARGAMEQSFGSTCHGAGRRMSRTRARRQIAGSELRRQLDADGIVVRCASNRGLGRGSPTRTTGSSPSSSRQASRAVSPGWSRSESSKGEVGSRGDRGLSHRKGATSSHDD